MWQAVPTSTGYAWKERRDAIFITGNYYTLRGRKVTSIHSATISATVSTLVFFFLISGSRGNGNIIRSYILLIVVMQKPQHVATNGGLQMLPSRCFHAAQRSALRCGVPQWPDATRRDRHCAAMCHWTAIGTSCVHWLQDTRHVSFNDLPPFYRHQTQPTIAAQRVIASSRCSLLNGPGTATNHWKTALHFIGQ